jgi:hypothetical protein
LFTPAPWACRKAADISVIELSLDQIASGLGAAFSDLRIEHGPGAATVVGDRSGLDETYVAVAGDRLVVSNDLGELTAHLAATWRSPDVAPRAVSHFLHDGLVPLPGTIHQGINRLSVGDWAMASPSSSKLNLTVGCAYPWEPSLSRQDQTPDTGRLLELLVSSVERQMAGLPGDGVLMMSSGKDSVAVAIALAELGARTPCVTFKAAVDDNEHVVAADFCERLGLDHHTVEMPADPSVTRANLVAFFEGSPSPTADHAAIAYVESLAASGITEGGCLDGGGNDPYMGYLISGASRAKLRYRVRGRGPASVVKRVIPVDSPINYLARSKAGALLPGRNPRFRETKRIYREALDTESFWYLQGRLAADKDLEGESTVSRLRHTEASRSHLKSRLAARAQGLSLVLPFCDANLADYYFHLPERARFDRATATNKLLLRQLLEETISYDPVTIGDGYFRFDGPAFMTSQAAFVRDEIRSCSLWGPGVGGMVDGWIDAIPRRPFLWHALFPLFMLSGWHNHSRFAAV